MNLIDAPEATSSSNDASAGAGLVAGSRAAHLRFSDFDAIAEGSVDFGYDFVPVETGAVDAELQRVDLGSVVILYGVGKLPHFAMHVHMARPTLLFMAGPCGEVIWDGQHLDHESVFSFGAESEMVGSTRGGSAWASVVSGEGILEQQAEALGVAGDVGVRNGPVTTPGASEMRELRSAVRQVLDVARFDPARLELPELQRALGEAVVTAAVHATHPAPERRSVAATSHLRVVRAAFDVLEARAGEPIYLAELCRVASVSERTLRSAFQHLYGVSPIRYLTLRRMELVRRALRDADPRECRVSAVASRFGFTNLGRFAAEFRRLYGESPLQMLRGA